MSRDFKVSIWTVGSWEFKRTFRAYHNLESQFYMKSNNEDQIIDDFDVSVLVMSNACNLLICGLYNGSVQFWDILPQKEELILEVPAHLAEVTAIALNYDQSIIVSAGADYLINVWNATAKTVLFEIRE